MPASSLQPCAGQLIQGALPKEPTGIYFLYSGSLRLTESTQQGRLASRVVWEDREESKVMYSIKTCQVPNPTLDHLYFLRESHKTLDLCPRAAENLMCGTLFPGSTSTGLCCNPSCSSGKSPLWKAFPSLLFKGAPHPVFFNVFFTTLITHLIIIFLASTPESRVRGVQQFCGTEWIRGQGTNKLARNQALNWP